MNYLENFFVRLGIVNLELDFENVIKDIDNLFENFFIVSLDNVRQEQVIDRTAVKGIAMINLALKDTTKDTVMVKNVN